MDLKQLTQKIPCQWRIGQISQQKPKATLLAYIDARDVMDLLDKVVGAENWQDEYKVVKDSLVAGIGIKCGNEWVWKWDTGTEGNIEKEKSSFSDSFKRAAVKWGVGRFLYSMGTEWVDTNEPKNANNKPYPVYPHNRERIWDLTEYVNSKDKYAKLEK